METVAIIAGILVGSAFILLLVFIWNNYDKTK